MVAKGPALAMVARGARSPQPPLGLQPERKHGDEDMDVTPGTHSEDRPLEAMQLSMQC